MKTWLVIAIAIVACSKHNNGTDGDATNASYPCGVFGTACTSGDTCCSGMCDPSGACTVNTTTCAAAGASCSANTDCCTVSCIGGACSATQCTADGATCTQNGACCSGACTNGTCAPLNGSCKTDGNPCGGNGDCCSSYCNASGTCGPSSWCVQNGDSCAHDAECCGGICNIAANAALGTCAQPVVGSTNCSAGVDGTVCNGCDSCCSRLCEVYAPTGVKVCQPAEGCRVDGDLCRQDSDCCGGSGTGLPGDGNVQCVKQSATDETGICRNPMSCDPEGDVCHYKNYATCGNSSARDDCCGAPGNSGVCQLDALGVPRCYGLGSACQMSGDTCAFAGDCCNGLPCVPDQNGVLRCGLAACVSMSGACTSTEDCCNGMTCVFQQGQTYGMCGGSAACAQDGQACSDQNPCCNNDCSYAGSNGTVACPPGMETGCTCFESIF